MNKNNNTFLLASLIGLVGAGMTTDYAHNQKPIIEQSEEEKERALAQATEKRERKRLRNLRGMK